jgi:hypothetical protein
MRHRPEHIQVFLTRAGVKFMDKKRAERGKGIDAIAGGVLEYGAQAPHRIAPHQIGLRAGQTAKVVDWTRRYARPHP